MIIIAFANPFAAYLAPGSMVPTPVSIWRLSMVIDIFAEGSMGTLFSMLFGAGMLIFLNKPNSDPLVVSNLYYRRTLLLVVLGLIPGGMHMQRRKRLRGEFPPCRRK